MNRRLLISLVFGLSALAGCGNGVPPDDGDAGSGAACSTNADCGSNEICVNQVCSSIGDNDGGTQDAGMTDGGSVCTTDTWGNFAENIIVTQCLSCHSHSHNFVDSYSSVKANRSTMQREVSNGSMPQYPQSLTSSERTRLVKWFSCGVPQ